MCSPEEGAKERTPCAFPMKKIIGGGAQQRQCRKEALTAILWRFSAMDMAMPARKRRRRYDGVS